MALPVAVWTSAQVREFEQLGIAQGVPAYTLMKRAGEGALRVLRSRWPRVASIAVVCGGGNNGGDGYVLARFARAAGLLVRVLAATDPAQLTGIARRAWEEALASGCTIDRFEPAALLDADVVVDALLGIGVRLPLRSDLRAVVEAINASGKPVLSLDLPSGLDGDTGATDGAAVRADVTVTFIALKTGLYCGQGPEFAGQ